VSGRVWGSRLAMSAALSVLLGACEASEKDSFRALEAHGFESIELSGAVPFACGEHDSFSQGFRAKNPRGERVRGVVCCGMMKACTVRF